MTSSVNSTSYSLRFGEFDVQQGVLSVSIERAGPNNEGVSGASVLVSKDAITSAIVDFRTQVQILDDQLQPQFSGTVDEAIVKGDTVEIRLVTTLTLLDEMKMGGLGIGAGTHFLDAAWSILRSSGISEDRIDIEGFVPGPLEVFEVVVPLDGVSLSESVSLGNVKLTPNASVHGLVGTLGPDELRTAYQSASCWAITLQNARTLFEAETSGLQAIDASLAWLAVFSRYSFPFLPGSRARDFKRSLTRSRVTRRNVVIVHGVATGRKWLRAPTDIANDPSVSISELDYLAAMSIPLSFYPDIQQSILAWHRSADDSNLLTAIVALWESIEFYASGHTAATPATFTKSERRAIRLRAVEGLDQAKADRVEQVLAMLNQPSLLSNLRSALKVDHVPHTDQEIDLLERIRKVRNDLVHGRSATLPDRGDVEISLGFVNRMIVHRVARLLFSDMQPHE